MRTTRSTATISGLVIMLLGIWGALIPFIGPYFDYAFGVDKAWHYTSDRLWLNILPGAIAVVGGMSLAFSARRPALAAGALLSLIAGAWFVVGPTVSLSWESGTGPIGRPLFGPVRQMWELLGYFYGVGALIVAFAAFSLGRIWSLSTTTAKDTPATTSGLTAVPQAAPPREPAVAAERPAQPVTAPEPVAAEPTVARQPSRRPGLLRRRGRARREDRGSPAGRQQ